MTPLFAAVIAALITIFFFVLFHAKIKNLWLRNILIVLATLFSLGIGGVLAGSGKQADITGQIFCAIIISSFLLWKYVLRKFFDRKNG